MWRSHSGYKWRHNMAHTSCMLDKEGYMHARACTRSGARTRTRASRTHNYVIFVAFPRQQWFANAFHCSIIRTLSVLLICSETLLCMTHPAYFLTRRRTYSLLLQFFYKIVVAFCTRVDGPLLGVWNVSCPNKSLTRSFHYSHFN